MVTTVTSNGVSLTSANTTFAFNNAGWITVGPGGDAVVAFACDLGAQQIAEVWARTASGWSAVDLGMITRRTESFYTPTVRTNGETLWLAAAATAPPSAPPSRDVALIAMEVSGSPSGYAEASSTTLSAAEDCRYPALAFDPTYGDLYLLYSATSPTSGGPVLELSVYTTLGAYPVWAHYTAYEDTSGKRTPTFGAIAVGTDGMSLAWKNEAAAGNTVRALYAPRGARFFDVTALVGGDVAGIDAGDAAPANDPSVVLTDSGDLYLAWQQAGADAGVSIWVAATADPASWALGAAEEVSVGTSYYFHQFAQLTTASGVVAGVSERGDAARASDRTLCDATWFIGRAASTPGMDADDAEGGIPGQGSAAFAIYPTMILVDGVLHLAWAEYDYAGGPLTIRYQRGEVSFA